MNTSKNHFSKNVLTLITGTTIAQAIPVIISPILTRIYTPEDFGILSLFTTLSLIFGNIANAKFELAIVLPDDDKDAINLAAISILISFSFSIILFIVIAIFNSKIASLLNTQEIKIYLYFVPMVVFLIGLFNTLSYLNVRLENYLKISKAHVYKSITASITQIIIGSIKSGPFGLITGNLISYLPLNFELGNETINKEKILSTINKQDIISVINRYINFPKFTLPASFINTSSRYIPNIFIPAYFSTSFLGFFSIINRILNIPLLLLGNSIGQVFTKMIAEEKNSGGNTKKIFDETLKKLVLVSLPIFTVLFFSVEKIFGLVFGETWQIGGYYCKILIPLFFVRFIAIPLSITMEIFSKQKYNLIWQLGLLVINILIFSITILLNLNFEIYLIFTTSILSIFYLLNIFMSRKFSGEKYLFD